MLKTVIHSPYRAQHIIQSFVYQDDNYIFIYLDHILSVCQPKNDLFLPAHQNKIAVNFLRIDCPHEMMKTKQAV